MDVFSISTISLIMFYVPGYIFIHIWDYFLLKKEKSQFEITIQGLLASAFITVFFLINPYQFINEKKNFIFEIITTYCKNGTIEKIVPFLIENLKTIGLLYLFLCLYSAIGSFFLAFIRKTKLVSGLIQKITKRDFFERVDIRFYAESLEKIVVVTMNDGTRYMGFLSGAPDNEQKTFIILTKPFVIEEGQLKELNASSLLVDGDKIATIEADLKENDNE